VVVVCWPSAVCAAVSLSATAVDVASDTDLLDCAFGFSTAVAEGMPAWTRAAVVGLREEVFDDEEAVPCPGLVVRAECAVPPLDFAGPAETEDESLSGLSALAMATVGQARDRPSATAAAPARAPRWTFAMEVPPSCVISCP